MGALIELGNGKRTLQNIQETLIEKEERELMTTIAPGSGLKLHAVEFENLEDYLQ